MATSDDVEAGVESVLGAVWNIRDGQVVPETEDVTLKNGAVKLSATYLYADLANSSTLAQKIKKEVGAKVIRSYLSAASRLIRWKGGAIRSFDGDRVMGVFIGTSKNTDAVRTALAINWAVTQVLAPKLKAKWPDLSNNYTLGHGIGVATGEVLIVRGGVRDNNDLISIGPAANVAAKLSDVRGKAASVFITKGVYDNMDDSVKVAKNKTVNMWSSNGVVVIGGAQYSTYSSTWWWKP